MSTLAKPIEFDENNLEDMALPAPRGRKALKGDWAELAGVTIAQFTPRELRTFQSSDGKMRQQEVVNKTAAWSLAKDDLRARWHDVTVRPNSGRVYVTDKTGVMVARLDDWAQAEKVFAAADILPAVKDRLAKAKALREKEEKVAADKLAASNRR